MQSLESLIERVSSRKVSKETEMAFNDVMSCRGMANYTYPNLRVISWNRFRGYYVVSDDPNRHAGLHFHYWAESIEKCELYIDYLTSKDHNQTNNQTTKQ